jgi:hypothetical protein
MTDTTASHELLWATPTYERRNPPCYVCSICGGLTGTRTADIYRHTELHAALAALLAPEGRRDPSR